MKHYMMRLVFAVMLLVVYHSGSADNLSAGESIVLDPVTGDYLITYADEDENGIISMSQTWFHPSTKIDPTVKSIFTAEGDSIVIYKYTVRNGAKSRQRLGSIIFDPVSDIVASIPLTGSMPQDREKDSKSKVARFLAATAAGQQALYTPYDWEGRSNPSRKSGLRISWGPILHQESPDDGLPPPKESELTDGLAPGKTQSGFGFASRDLPGLGVAQLRGRVYFTLAYSGGGADPSSEIGARIDKLYQNDFVARNAAVPTIGVPIPFNASVLLSRIQSHMHTWIASGLLDATFSSQLDRYFQAAIDAYNHHQPKVGKEHIETLRKMLKREHEGIDHEEDEKAEERNEHKSARLNIDRLAARILDFDLKYVLKRMEGKDKD